MNVKLTKMIYQEFLQRYPLISKNATKYYPWKNMTILIWMKDGSKMEYSYLTKLCTMIMA